VIYRVIKHLTEKGVSFDCLSQPGISTTNATGKLLPGVLASIAEFEADLRRERQREGIERAKAAGVYRGRKRSIDPAQVGALRDQGHGGAEIAKKLGIGRASVYRALNEGAGYG
jgi:DNA invertase Pin-like site-specific DNA recombinase